MNSTTNLTFSSTTSPQLQPARKPRNFASLALRHRSLCRKQLDHHTGKELDSETGFYYYGARYLDPKTSRWLSGDPALGEYLPSAPINEEARKRNGNLPGMGGVFNYVNLHVYHYAGNNPVVMKDPDGEDIIDANTTKEQFNEMNIDSFTGEVEYWAASKWNGMQSFLAENPDGAYYRAPGEMHWQQYENKKDINIIDPNSAMSDVLLFYGIGKSLVNGIGKKITSIGIKKAIKIDLQWFGKNGKNIESSLKKTAQEVISATRKGSINRVFPKEWLNVPVSDIEKAAKAGDKTAKTAMKLINDNRFIK